MKTNVIYQGNCYSVLKKHFPDNSIDLIYMDPPFSFDPKYAKLWYDKETLKEFEELRKGKINQYISWLSKKIEQCHRVLKDTGSMYLHCDWKFGHYIKIEMDNIFGYGNFKNEIIWHYFMGGKSKKFFARKHDTILFYTKSEKWTFNPMKKKRRLDFKPSLPAISSSGKPTENRTGKDELGYYSIVTMDDVWDIKGVFNMSKEYLSYPTQKPEALLERIIRASSNPNDIVLDPMCGCGTTIVTAHKLNRRWIGIDISSKACEVMQKRMQSLEGILEVPIIRMPSTIEGLKELTAFEFEDYICEMIDAEKTKHVADRGIDGYYEGHPIQIKQQERVGRNTIDNFETALRRRKKDKGAIIAFSFTRNAYEEAARAKEDKLNISLIRVDELIIKDYELKLD